MGYRDVFSGTEKKFKEDMYVLINNYGLSNEDVIGAYETEVLAFKDSKRLGCRNKKIVKADVEYICVENIDFMWDYTIK